jgi:hypothetical protein
MEPKDVKAAEQSVSGKSMIYNTPITQPLQEASSKDG